MREHEHPEATERKATIETVRTYLCDLTTFSCHGVFSFTYSRPRAVNRSEIFIERGNRHPGVQEVFDSRRD